jgi:alpha-L-arabinofuranosidase
VHRSTVTIDPTLRVADVDPRLFGSFVEHMGRCVYTGIYEPGHDTTSPT